MYQRSSNVIRGSYVLFRASILMDFAMDCECELSEMKLEVNGVACNKGSGEQTCQT